MALLQKILSIIKVKKVLSTTQSDLQTVLRTQTRIAEHIKETIHVTNQKLEDEQRLRNLHTDTLKKVTGRQ
tara:strand:- start:2329 stop:2541 length:213 start_codon:yes stop_codon:yes gene_type:complete